MSDNEDSWFKLYGKSENDVELPFSTHLGVWVHGIIFGCIVFGYLVNIGRASYGISETSNHFFWITLICVSAIILLISLLKRSRTRELINTYTDREIEIQSCPDYFKEEYDENGKVCKPYLSSRTAEYAGGYLNTNPIYGNLQYETNEDNLRLSDINSASSAKQVCANANEHSLIKDNKHPWSEVSTKCQNVSNEPPTLLFESKGFFGTLFEKLV